MPNTPFWCNREKSGLNALLAQWVHQNLGHASTAVKKGPPPWRRMGSDFTGNPDLFEGCEAAAGKVLGRFVELWFSRSTI